MLCPCSYTNIRQINNTLIIYTRLQLRTLDVLFISNRLGIFFFYISKNLEYTPHRYVNQDWNYIICLQYKIKCPQLFCFYHLNLELTLAILYEFCSLLNTLLWQWLLKSQSFGYLFVSLTMLHVSKFLILSWTLLLVNIIVKRLHVDWDKSKITKDRTSRKI